MSLKHPITRAEIEELRELQRNRGNLTDYGNNRRLRLLVQNADALLDAADERDRLVEETKNVSAGRDMYMREWVDLANRASKSLTELSDERDRLRALLSRAGAMLLAFESSEASVLDSEELRERIEAELRRPGT